MYLLRKCQRAFESISSEWSFCIGAAVGAIFVPAALFLCLLLPRSRGFWAAAGTILLLVLRFLPGFFASPPFEELLGGRSALVEYEIKVDDLRLTAVPDLETPAGVWCELTAFSWSGDKEVFPCRGRVLVYSSYPLPRRYGSVVTGEGRLWAPEYDRPGAPWIMETDVWKLKKYDNSWRSYVFQIRDKLLERLCSSIINDTNRNLAAAFFLGNTGGMNPERRRDFAAAGTIHLFAVSGLHVGMAAMLFLLLLRFFPFRLRCFAAAAGVWGYVLLTGAAVPALRAGFMISLFLICRGMLFSTPPLRLMGIAAGIIIIADPDAVNSIGFHYSFFITAVLLLLSVRLQELRQLEGRLFTIMPMTAENLAQRRLFNFGFSLKGMVFSGIAAVLAGSVVSMYHDLALTPGAVVANWFTMPLLGILFALLPVKLLASFMTPGIDRAAAQMIEGIFNYLRTVAEIMGDLAMPFYAYPPGIWLTAAMILLLLGSLLLENKKYAAVSGGLFLLLFLSFPCRSWWASSRVTVISSDYSSPATVIVSDQALGEVTLVNPVRGHLRDMENAVKRAGTSRISSIYFSAPSVRNLSGLDYMARRYAVEKLFMPPMTGRNWQFSDRITEGRGEFFYIPEGSGGGILRLFREKNKFAIEYPDSGVMLNWRLEIKDCDNGRTVKFIRRGKENSVTLPWSSRNGVWQHEL